MAKTKSTKRRTTGFQRVDVYWIDTVTRTGWSSPEQASEVEPASVVTSGILIGESATRVTVAGTWGEESEGEFSGVWVIPRGVIRRIVRHGRVERRT